MKKPPSNYLVEGKFYLTKKEKKELHFNDEVKYID